MNLFTSIELYYSINEATPFDDVIYVNFIINHPRVRVSCSKKEADNIKEDISKLLNIYFPEWNDGGVKNHESFRVIDLPSIDEIKYNLIKIRERSLYIITKFPQNSRAPFFKDNYQFFIKFALLQSLF